MAQVQANPSEVSQHQVETPQQDLTYHELHVEQHEDLGRWYHTPFGAYPSITTVLGATQPSEKVASLEAWRQRLGEEEADRQSKEATEHGSSLHAMVEAHLRGEPLPSGDERDIGAFRTIKPLLRHVVPWGIEVPLYSQQLMIAGRTDCVGTYEGVPAIMDWKTAKRLKKDVDDYKLQLCFYAQAHNEMFGTDIKRGVIIMASDGFPQRWMVDLPPLLPRLLNRADLYWQQLEAAMKDHL